MHIVIVILSSLIGILANVPYQLDVARGLVKPRIATWLVWAMLSGVGGIAALSAHQIPAAVFCFCTFGSKTLIVILGFRQGDRKFGPLDIMCLVGAMIGVVLLITQHDPTAAVIVAIFTDYLGSIPTFKHSWEKPYEEKLSTYGLYVISEWLILLIANYGVFTAYAFPLFYLLEDGILASLVFLSPHWRDRKKIA
jgi:hypothetical protein